MTVVDLPDDQVLVRRMYLAEARVFWLTARYPRSSPVEAQKFFDSFKITTVAKAKSAPPIVAEGPKPPEPPPPSNPPTTRKDPPAMTSRVPDPPPVAQPPPMPPPMNPAAFQTSAEEQALVEAINRLRAGAGQAVLAPQQKLYEISRARANAQAQGAAIPNNGETGYLVNNVLSIPARGTTAQQLVEDLAKTKAFRSQLLDDEVQFIGVGMATDKNGFTRNVIYLAGNPK